MHVQMGSTVLVGGITIPPEHPPPPPFPPKPPVVIPVMQAHKKLRNGLELQVSKGIPKPIQGDSDRFPATLTYKISESQVVIFRASGTHKWL